MKTTPRKVLQNLLVMKVPAPEQQFFLGKVRYMTESEIANMMNGLSLSDVLTAGGKASAAQLLSIKREAFRHESELRLIYQDWPDHKLGVKGIFTFKVNPGSLFEEVVIDPRLSTTDAKLTEQRLAASGWSGLIRQSDLYQVPSFTIQP